MSRAANFSPSYSLRKRLVLAFGLLLILFLGLAGVVLNNAFKESVAAAVEERLQLQIYALLGVAEPEDDGFYVPELEDPRFSQIDSGLYGMIFSEAGTELWRSASALNFNLPTNDLFQTPLQPGQIVFDELELPVLGPLSYASYGIFWANHETEYRFVVFESTAPSAAEIKEFQSNLWFWLGGLALLLSTIQYFLLRWGLSPLQALAEEVSEIEAGDSDHIDGHYPAELEAIGENMNLLIKSERDRQSRYQSTLGDLAHSLKTPLAVISGVVQEKQKKPEDTPADGVEDSFDDGFDDIAEQVERMNQIVSYQLKRAVQSQHNPLMARNVSVNDVLGKILRTLAKVYQDKQVSLKESIDKNVMFHGEESDLMELCGNLLDNAYKYTRSEICISASMSEGQLYIEISDNGDGIPDSQKNWVLERGARADTVMSGQGIGLAVAVDIISSYGGRLEMGESDVGGAKIQVYL